MAGCEDEEKSFRCHLDSDSIGEEGSSVGEENDVDEEEEVRLDVISSAPLEVTSLRVRVRARRSPVDKEVSGGTRVDDGSARTVLMLRDFLRRRLGRRRPDVLWSWVWRMILLVVGAGAEAVLCCDNGLFSLVRLPALMPLLVFEDGCICLFIRSSTSLGLKATRARNFCTALSSANSMAQWFLIMLTLGQVARSPLSMACRMNSGVGFESIRGKSE